MKKETVKIMIFDMDGVILDSEPLHENARQMMFRNFGIVPDKNFPNPVGKSSSGFWRTVSGLCGLDRDAYELEAEQYRLVAVQIKENNVPVSDGLMDLLNWAKEHGVKIGLASSSTRVLVDDTLNLLGVREYFDYTVSGDEVQTKKPAPDPYLKVLNLSGFAPEEAFAVEDSNSGVQAAKNAGIFCYGYDNPTSGDQDLSNADQVIKSLKEILA
jgi:HAD superfamily hydrolase (TIGR01509 family)